MLPIISALILVLAVSLDGFAVGIMYGLRKIRIPIISVTIISFCSGLIIFASMQIGTFLMRFLSVKTAEGIGACILIGIGMWAVARMFSAREHTKEVQEHHSSSSDTLVHKRTIISIELKTLGLVVEILKRPAAADVDRSGNISSGEAALLGIALSFDAFGAGIGAAMIGLSPWLTPILIALASGLFLTAGLKIGYLISKVAWVRSLSIFPGLLLIVIGVFKLM